MSLCQAIRTLFLDAVHLVCVWHKLHRNQIQCIVLTTLQQKSWHEWISIRLLFYSLHLIRIGVSCTRIDDFIKTLALRWLHESWEFCFFTERVHSPSFVNNFAEETEDVQRHTLSLLNLSARQIALKPFESWEERNEGLKKKTCTEIWRERLRDTEQSIRKQQQFYVRMWRIRWMWVWYVRGLHQIKWYEMEATLSIALCYKCRARKNYK